VGGREDESEPAAFLLFVAVRPLRLFAIVVTGLYIKESMAHCFVYSPAAQACGKCANTQHEASLDCLLLLPAVFQGMHILILFAFDVWVLDGQAPNVQVVTDCGDNIMHETPVDAKSQTEHQEHKRYLVDVVTEHTVPQTKPTCETVDNRSRQRDEQDILERELILYKMSDNHLADAVGVDDACEYDERNEMLVEDDWVERQVGWNQGPGDSDRQEP